MLWGPGGTPSVPFTSTGHRGAGGHGDAHRLGGVGGRRVGRVERDVDLGVFLARVVDRQVFGGGLRLVAGGEPPLLGRLRRRQPDRRTPAWHPASRLWTRPTTTRPLRACTSTATAGSRRTMSSRVQHPQALAPHDEALRALRLACAFAGGELDVDDGVVWERVEEEQRERGVDRGGTVGEVPGRRGAVGAGRGRAPRGAGDRLLDDALGAEQLDDGRGPRRRSELAEAHVRAGCAPSR